MNTNLSTPVFGLPPPAQGRISARRSGRGTRTPATGFPSVDLYNIAPAPASSAVNPAPAGKAAFGRPPGEDKTGQALNTKVKRVKRCWQGRTGLTVQMLEPDFWRCRGRYSKQACRKGGTDPAPISADDFQSAGSELPEEG